jgi:hypothetical protein
VSIVIWFLQLLAQSKSFARLPENKAANKHLKKQEELIPIKKPLVH